MGGSTSHSDLGGGESSKKNPKPVLIFGNSMPCVFCLLLEVVGYYAAMFSKNKVWMGWVGGVISIQKKIGFFKTL